MELEINNNIYWNRRDTSLQFSLTVIWPVFQDYIKKYWSIDFHLIVRYFIQFGIPGVAAEFSKTLKGLHYFLKANSVTINRTPYHWIGYHHTYWGTMLSRAFDTLIDLNYRYRGPIYRQDNLLYGYVVLRYEKHAIWKIARELR